MGDYFYVGFVSAFDTGAYFGGGTPYRQFLLSQRRYAGHFARLNNVTKMDSILDSVKMTLMMMTIKVMLNRMFVKDIY